MIMSKYRIPMPRTAEDLLKLAQLIEKKDVSDGKESILNSLDMNGFRKLLQETIDNQEERDRLRKESVAATEKVRLMLGTLPNQSVFTPGTLTFFIGQVRSLLITHYRDSQKQLGHWGFNVLNGKASSNGDEPSEDDEHNQGIHKKNQDDEDAA